MRNLHATPTPTGLTPFLTGMVTASDADLAKAQANAAKVAARHGLPVETVRFNLDWWRARQ